jgi:sn-glycerol 3-phosphate transport system permease protein
VTMAYAFVYIRFPYRKVILLFVLATMAVPEEVKIIPNFLLITRLNWVNTYAGLIIPVAAHAFPVFVMTQWFRMLPRELVEAARVDGAGHLRTLLAVILPSSRSVLIVLGIFSFVNRWNDYLWPLIATNKVSMRTLPIGLAYLRSSQENIGRWDLLMAASLLATLPLLLIFVIFQGQIVGGVRGFLPSRKT